MRFKVTMLVSKEVYSDEGELFRIIRERGSTVTQVSGETEISAAHLFKLDAGTSSVNLPMAIRIASALNCSVNDIFGTFFDN